MPLVKVRSTKGKPRGGYNARSAYWLIVAAKKGSDSPQLFPFDSIDDLRAWAVEHGVTPYGSEYSVTGETPKQWVIAVRGRRILWAKGGPPTTV